MSIFNVDLDGVLVDWTDAIAELFGVDVALAREANRTHRISEVLGLSKTQMWDRVMTAGSDLWSNMKVHEDAWSVFMQARALLGDRVRILTAPIYHHDCYAGKARWVMDRLGNETSAITICRDKWLLAGPGRYLIDDNAEKCHDFESHPYAIAGGKSILVPRMGDAGRAGALDQFISAVRAAA